MLISDLQFVIVSLSGWGLVFFGGYKALSGGKKEEVLSCSLLELLNPISLCLWLNILASYAEKLMTLGGCCCKLR